jgi:hypothetical protein
MVWHKALWPAITATMIALPAGARTYCCSDESGRRVCGDIVPVECLKRPYQEFDGRGMLVRRYEGPTTAEERDRRDAERARRQEAERQAREVERGNRALRASYASAGEIDAKRDRLLIEANENLKLAQERLDTAAAHKQKLDAEAEFFQKKPMPEAAGKLGRQETGDRRDRGALRRREKALPQSGRTPLTIRRRACAATDR